MRLYAVARSSHVVAGPLTVGTGRRSNTLRERVPRQEATVLGMSDHGKQGKLPSVRAEMDAASCASREQRRGPASRAKSPSLHHPPPDASATRTTRANSQGQPARTRLCIKRKIYEMSSYSTSETAKESMAVRSQQESPRAKLCPGEGAALRRAPASTAPHYVMTLPIRHHRLPLPICIISPPSAYTPFSSYSATAS